MKNDEFKKAFDSIKTDEVMKKKILTSINEKNKNNYKKEEKYFMNYKKLAVIAASLTVVVGVAAAIPKFAPNNNNNNNTNTNTSAPAGSPMTGDLDLLNQPNTNINLDTLSETLSSIEIQTHNTDKTLVTINDKTVITKIIEGLQSSTERTLTDADYEAIAKGQSDGKSFSLNLIFTDNTNAIVRINTAVDSVYFNDAYHAVDPELTNLILGELSSIPNLDSINSPAQG